MIQGMLLKGLPSGLHQGIFKHLIDARCRRLPPNHNIRMFLKGISCLSRITGHKHDQIAHILLGLVIDLPLPGGISPVRLVRAIRALLDFLYLAQYPVHTDDTLAVLEEALETFHKNSWRILKLHFATHWAQKVRHFGTADNSDTEHTERLHVDFAKDAYAATNHKDEFAQMTKIFKHEQYVNW
ncbi:hypothetical protein BKA70DRAFT_1379819 [Coprinopsis sp. MPI-PUGE-AT-0042]|nr:hypothetical protein BKA70DRAFT_1379819 [Coprinopsis sp. MPI-PUGE-AT-0042]